MKFNKLCEMVIINEKLGDTFFIQLDPEMIRLIDIDKITKLQKIVGITSMKQKNMSAIDAQKFLEGLIDYLSIGGTFEEVNGRTIYDGEGVSLSDVLSSIQLYIRDNLDEKEEFLGSYLSSAKAERAADKIRKFLTLNKMLKDTQAHLIKKDKDDEEQKAIDRISKEIESGEDPWGVSSVDDIISNITNSGIDSIDMN